jgi:hypothetical protein
MQWLLNTQKKLVTQRSMVIAASFLKAKKCVCQHDEAERAAMDETPPTDETHKEDPCEKLYKECFFNYENCTSGECVRESDIDSKFTESRDELYLLTIHCTF